MTLFYIILRYNQNTEQAQWYRINVNLYHGALREQKPRVGGGGGGGHSPPPTLIFYKGVGFGIRFFFKYIFEKKKKKKKQWVKKKK